MRCADVAPECLDRRLQFHAGINVGTGKDYTLFALSEGVAVYETIKQKSCVRPSPCLSPRTAVPQANLALRCKQKPHAGLGLADRPIARLLVQACERRCRTDGCAGPRESCLPGHMLANT